MNHPFYFTLSFALAHPSLYGQPQQLPHFFLLFRSCITASTTTDKIVTIINTSTGFMLASDKFYHKSAQPGNNALPQNY